MNYPIPKYKAILPLLSCDSERNLTIEGFIGTKLSLYNQKKKEKKSKKLFRKYENEDLLYQTKTIAMKKLILPPIKFTPQKSLQLSKLRASYNVVTKSIEKPKIINLKDNFAMLNRFYRLKIHEEILKVKRRNLELSKKGDKELFYLQPLKFDNLACIGGLHGVGIDEYLFNTDCHVEMVASMIQRLQRIHLREKTKFKVFTDNIILDIDFMEKNTFNIVIKNDSAKSFGKFKMSLEKNKIIPNFVRASRQSDEQLLNILLKNILINKLPEISLNIQDVSGRTALSYLASNQRLSKYIDVIFQIPGVDANQPDNKGDIPLHYATKSESLFKKVLMYSDAVSTNVKNGKGITPIMKLLSQKRN